MVIEEELDPHAIFASVGEVPYEWLIDSDRIVWGRNVGAVLPVADPAALDHGRSYAQLVDPNGGPSRFDAVMRASASDCGSGVPYQLQYALNAALATPDLIRGSDQRGHSISARAIARPETRVNALVHSPEAGSSVRAGGERKLWIEDTGRWFGGRDGRPIRAHGVVRVINERHEREQRLAYLSRFDALTGEMNRWHISEVLEAVVEDAVKLRSSCGFMLLAIDDLGRINQGYGFDVADEVIADIAKRIRRQLRGKDHLGRFSGNKFGIILNNCTPDDMLIAADRLLAGVRDDVVQTSAGAVAATGTIGSITAPRYARNLREILSRAQEALDAAKAKRRGSFQAYRPNLERDRQRRENVRDTEDIITALNARRIFLAYEPVVATASRRPAFYECLMRVKRADGTPFAVHEAVSVAERLGLVRLLDHRVLELALAELVAAPALKASLNVSAASTVDPDWWGALGATLRSHPGIGERLTVEITETAAIHDIDETRGFVARVKDLGCRIAIDDFGAGNTSFRNLRKLGVDIVKIDGAFVQNLTRSDDDRAFVHTLIDLARRLGLETVAEWVQDEAAAALLADWGCDYLQGALVGLASRQRPWLEAAARVSA